MFLTVLKNKNSDNNISTLSSDIFLKNIFSDRLIIKTKKIIIHFFFCKYL